jgi:hypothetical protein
MTFGSLLSLTPIFKAVLEENNRITTMAAAAKKWPPIATHELQFREHTHWIGGERYPEQGDIFFLQ